MGESTNLAIFPPQGAFDGHLGNLVWGGALENPSCCPHILVTLVPDELSTSKCRIPSTQGWRELSQGAKALVFGPWKGTGPGGLAWSWVQENQGFGSLGSQSQLCLILIWQAVYPLGFSLPIYKTEILIFFSNGVAGRIKWDEVKVLPLVCHAIILINVSCYYIKKVPETQNTSNPVEWV